MSEHTPGPWQPFDTDGKPVNDPSVTSEKHVIATVWINDLSRKQAVANTNLMAAAPDLHEQLGMAYRLLGQVLGEGFFDWAEAKAIRATLAKAEGRS